MSALIHNGSKKETCGVNYVLVDHTTSLCLYDLE